MIYGYFASISGSENLIRIRHAFPAMRSLRIVPGMPRSFRDSRSLRRCSPVWRRSAAMILLLSLAACEGFPGFGRREDPLPQLIFIEVPVPQVEIEPEPEKPMAPLPTKKPAAASPARREQPGNGHASGTPGHLAGPEGDPAAEPQGNGSIPSESPPAGRDTPAQAPEPPAVTGLNRAALVAQFGAPVAERAAAPAKVLEFGGGDCLLAAFLYFDTSRNDFYVLQYQVNGMSDRNEAADRCLMRIRDAARR